LDQDLPKVSSQKLRIYQPGADHPKKGAVPAKIKWQFAQEVAASINREYRNLHNQLKHGLTI
jgi:hypothetical protein